MKKIINLLTCSLTLTLLGGCNFNKYSYEDHQKYVSGSDFTLESRIDEIEVAWVNGNITITQTETDKVSVKEEDYGEYPLYYYLDGTTLKIQYVENGTSQNEVNKLEKDLFITTPIDLENPISVDFNLVNGNCSFLNESKYNEVDVNLVNGNVIFNQALAKDVEVNIVNGNFTADAFVSEKLSLSKVNGDSIFNPIYNKTDIEISTVNGTDTLYILPSFGYSVDAETIGNFTSEYDNLKVYGTPVINIEYEGVNGNLVIKKA